MRLARQVEQTLKGVAGAHRRPGAPHHDLFHPRPAGLGAAAQRRIDHRHRAEGKHLQPELGAHGADDAGRGRGRRRLGEREKAGPPPNRPTAAAPRPGAEFALEELVGQLREDARAVAGLTVVATAPRWAWLPSASSPISNTGGCAALRCGPQNRCHRHHVRSVGHRDPGRGRKAIGFAQVTDWLACRMVGSR